MASDDSVRAVLQAGGQGRRMGSDRSGVPKPLRKVGGVPMVERLLRQLAAAGIRDISLIRRADDGRVEDHVGRLRNLPDELTLHWIRETAPRGNVGSLAELPREPGRVLLAFGDLVTDLDFCRLLAVHRERGCDVTLTSHFESHRLRLGEVVVEGDRVVGYQEKPEKSFLICSGIAVFERDVLDLISRDRSWGISDLIAESIRAGRRVTHWLHGAFWMDVNSPEELEIANRALARFDGSQATEGSS